GDDGLVARIVEPSAARFDLTFPPEPRSFSVADVQQLHGHRLAAEGDVRVSELPRREDEPGKRASGALIRRLEIVWPPSAQRLTVVLVPDCDDDELALPVTPLDDWLARRPVRLTRYPQPEYRTAFPPGQPEWGASAGVPAFEAGHRGKHAPKGMDHV